MRRVACYAAKSSIEPTENPDKAHGVLDQLVTTWIASKGNALTSADQSEVRLSGGRVGRFSREELRTSDGRLSEYTLIEPTESGQFLTRLLIGSQKRFLCVFVELRAGGEALQVRPIPIDARCPDVYRQILDSREWYTGESIVRTKPIAFFGTRGAEQFIRVLKHNDRNLPMIAVSMVGGEALTRDLGEHLARDLAGLALVCMMDEAASWAVTQGLGRDRWPRFFGQISSSVRWICLPC